MDKPAWQGNDLHTALRLMCIPRVLVPRADHIDESCLASAALVERALLENGFEHPELVDFSMKGISLGYAYGPASSTTPSRMTARSTKTS